MSTYIIEEHALTGIGTIVSEVERHDNRADAEAKVKGLNWRARMSDDVKVYKVKEAN